MAPAALANLVDLLAEETKPPAEQNTLKAIDNLQAELAQVQAQLSQHKGQLRRTEWWLKTGPMYQGNQHSKGSVRLTLDAFRAYLRDNSRLSLSKFVQKLRSEARSETKAGKRDAQGVA